jgi:AhpD family alkylhydroperoxidase
MAPWLLEIPLRLPGLLASYTRPSVLDPRTRERLILAVTEVNGCRYCAWIHGNWADFLGDGISRLDAEEAVLTYARACADAGKPLDPAPLRERGLPAASIEAVRATVAQIEVSNLVGNTVDGLIARLTRKRPLSPVAAIQELAVIGAAVPLAIPMIAVGAAFKAVARVGPPMPQVGMPPKGEANLLVHLLAAAIPTYLANAAVRLAILGLPFEVAVGLKAGRTTATVRVGRSSVSVENGISPDALAVVEGEVEPLLKLASGNVVGELRKLRLRPT